MRKTLKGLLAFGAVAVIAVAGYLSYRNNAMLRLYAEAAGHTPFYRGSRESQTAVKKLAAYRGQRSTSMLLEIALRQNPLAPEAQTEAIKALQERQDPQVAVALANLLQPHEGLKTRQAAATALKGLPCKDDCVRSTLHYLDRVSRGELNYEDCILHAPGSEDVAASLKKDQEVLYGTLYAVLQREKPDALRNLVAVYGLGSANPSAFALDMASRLGLREACPYLLLSDQQIKNLSPEFYKAPRQELQAAITSLGCK